MSYELMQHQEHGVRFLMDRHHGLLAFEQGLGKTLVAIDAFARLLQVGKCNRMIVICPNSLKRNWASELGQFTPFMSFDIVEGSPQARRRQMINSRARVLILSYETARAEVIGLKSLMQGQTCSLVLDESHATKNWSSLTSKAAREIAPFAKFRWLLSGTPVTNHATDLYTQLEILAPDRNPLGTEEAFLAEIDADPTGEFFRNEIDAFVFRRTKEECLDLPAKSFADIRVELPPWQRKLYDDMRQQMACQIQDMTGEEYKSFASTALAQLTRLSQLASNPSLLFPESTKTPAKFAMIEEVLTDLLAVPGRKVIIWCNYVSSIEQLLDRLAIYEPIALYGAVPGPKRQELAKKFQDDSATRVLIANPAAAGTGFTLTAANYTIYESLSWRYDHYAQSQDRNHRIGQELPVTYLRLIANDTIDEAIIRALGRKTGLAKALLGDADTGSLVSRFTKEEMVELLTNNKLPKE